MLEQIRPMDIERRSFEIITELLGDRKLDPENELVIKRAIHTTADFDYADNLVAMMNEKAAALGLANTHFMNTSGLHDENHYSTVREIALILQAALENETCTEILSAENYRASETEQHPDGLAMTNKFLYRVHHEYALNGAEITAAKTGYTAEAMNCCASAGKTPDGRSVICVTANAWTGEFCIEDHIALYTKYCGSAEAE